MITAKLIIVTIIHRNPYFSVFLQKILKNHKFTEKVWKLQKKNYGKKFEFSRPKNLTCLCRIPGIVQVQLQLWYKHYPKIHIRSRIPKPVQFQYKIWQPMWNLEKSNKVNHKWPITTSNYWILYSSPFSYKSRSVKCYQWCPKGQTKWGFHTIPIQQFANFLQ